MTMQRRSKPNPTHAAAEAVHRANREKRFAEYLAALGLEKINKHDHPELHQLYRRIWDLKTYLAEYEPGDLETRSSIEERLGKIQNDLAEASAVALQKIGR
jgi:hypothetical protein